MAVELLGLEDCEETHNHRSQPGADEYYSRGQAALPVAQEGIVTGAEGGLLRKISEARSVGSLVSDGTPLEGCQIGSALVSGSPQVAPRTLRQIQGEVSAQDRLLGREANTGGRDDRPLRSKGPLAKLSGSIRRIWQLVGYGQLRERRQLVRLGGLLSMWPTVRPHVGN